MKLKILIYNSDKYVTTQEFNNLTSGDFSAKIAQENLASKSDIANFVKKTDFEGKLKNAFQIKMN